MQPGLAFLENLGFGELVVIMGIALLLFGERLPNVARSFGKGMAEFKKSMRESTEQVKREIEKAADPVTEPLQEFKREISTAGQNAVADLPPVRPPGFNENKMDESLKACAETPMPQESGAAPEIAAAQPAAPQAVAAVAAPAADKPQA